MGVELLEIGVKVRNGVILIVRGCYRSVCNHPFLVGMLCFLIFLYRLSPFLFQLLVSASPILVCTAVLLGTLLSFGQPNLPEIEVEDKTTHEGASIKTGVSVETATVEKNESYYVERFSEKRLEEAEKSTDLSVGKLGEVLREDSDDTAPLIEEKSLETDSGIGEGNRKLGNLGYEQKSDWIEERLNNGEIVENHYVSAGKVDDELVESDDEKSEADSFDSEKVNVDSLDSPPPSPWARVEQRKDEEEDGSDSGSDRAESSSPDASMADIMPMLDELHPLLDEEAPQTVHIAHDGSDAASEKSHKSSTSGHESDDESENHGDLEVADDDNEDEEDGQGDREDLTKSAITWTEEDEKNLMDLGSSEIERNQRLENLILRRKARKMLADRNLIDLEGSDLPFDIAPISTRRKNPFDLPNDYYDDSGLPPIPGSAPSVLLQWRNPFDIPYDSSEEKPDLMRDGFQEEFRTCQSREPVFRRHESFNVGPSNFAPKRKDVKLRPYFVPEGSVSEESSSSLFRRQSSELSESKLSSVPDTESVSSVTSIEDQEQRKFVEEDNLLEAEVVAQMEEVAEEGPSGDSDLISQQTEEDGHQEPETNAKMECVFEHVGHGSQSLEEDDDSLELGQVEKRDVEVGELESRIEDVIDHDNRRYTRDSTSSLSEGSERVFTVTEGEGLSMLEEIRHDVAQEPGISTQTVQNTDLNITGALVDDIPHSEPVYDSSPREISKNVSTSSISSDLGSIHFIDKRTVSSIEREFDGGSQEIVTDIPDNIEMLPDPSVAQSIYEFGPIDAVDIREHDNVETDFSGVDQKSISEGSSTYARITPHMSIPLKSSDEASESFEDRDLEQEKYSLPSGRESIVEVSEPLFEGQLSRHSVGMEEVVQSPNANAEVSHEADEKLISTPLSGGNTTVFHDKAINEPNHEHMNEAQASSTPVEFFVDTQKLNTTEDQNLDHHISSHISSPSSPEYVTIPPATIEMATRVDVQRTVEEVDEIKEIDDGLLSELDIVGDFSVNQLGSDSTESEKHVDSVGEESLPSPHAEASTIRGVEVPSVEVNKIEDTFLSENSREHIDISEEDVDRISELQTSETRRADNIEASRVEFNENDGQDSLLSHDYEDTVSTIPEVEVRSFEDVDAIPLEKAELTSTGTEIIGEEDKLPDQSQVDTDTASVMPELEASTIEDIDLAFKQISSEEIEKPKVLETILISEETVSAKPETEVQSKDGVDVPLEKAESTSMENETMVGGGDETSQGQVDPGIPCGMTELEASKIEDIDLAFKHVSSKEIEEPVALEPSEAHLYSYEDNISVIHELEARSVGGFHADPEKAEFASAETQIKANTDSNSELTELEASTIEDIGLAFKQVTSMDIENPVVLESPQAELAVGELHKDSSVMSTHETTVSTGPVEDGTLNDKQLADSIEGSDRLHDSADQTLHVVESGDTQRDSSELHVAEQIPPECTPLPPHLVLDGEMVEQLQPNEDDGSLEVEAHKVIPSEMFNVKEAVEKPEHEAEVPEASHSTSSVKGRGKFSKSSSSSSSSSSESSSSDSDEE